MEKQMSIWELFGKSVHKTKITPSPLIVSDTLIGVEVELEGVSNIGAIAEASKFWAIKEDGSLKNNGIEFVMATPQGGANAVEALKELETLVDMMDELPELSQRTSVHVHVDMRDTTYKQYVNYILLYIIFERPLFNFCGSERFGNTFCRPLTETYQMMEAVGQMSKSGNHLAEEVLAVRGNKYMALNVAATRGFGSVEFRGHRGEYRFQQLINWVNLLLRMRSYALEEIDWKELPTMASRMGVSNFIKQIFKEESNLIQSMNLEYEIIQGIRVAQDIIFRDDILKSQSDMVKAYREASGDVSSRIKKLIEKKEKK